MCDICQAGAAAAAAPQQLECTQAAQTMLRVLEAGFVTAKHATLKQLLQAWQKDKASSQLTGCTLQRCLERSGAAAGPG